MSDIVKIHESKCPQFKEKTLQLSCDGVHENKSSSVSLDIYSTCFKHCKNIYPHKIVRPLGKFKVDSKKQLGNVVDDILENKFQISQFIADNKVRSDAKQALCHSAWYPCEYCYAKGTKIDLIDYSARNKLISQRNAIQEKINDCENEEKSQENERKINNLKSLKTEIQKSINNMKKKSNILWPSSTINCEHRSRRSILDIVRKIENNENLSIDEAKGITGRSLLLDIPGFNFVYDSPTEYLHCACLGVIKKLVELTFNVGTNRPRVTKRKLSSPITFNILMSSIKVPKESSRRARDLDFAVFKGEEFRNIALFYFPLVLECIEENAKDRQCWLYIGFLMRSSCIPSEEFANLNLQEIETICENFYKMYELLYGIRNCTYNTHVFCSHLLEIRTHGPLTETSAFKFESFYGEVRRSFVPGTPSPAKQMMQKIMLKRALSSHCCRNTIVLSNYETPLESNKYVYTYFQKKYNFFEISKINNETVSCHELGQYEAKFQETDQINWSSVGVFRKGPKTHKLTTLNVSEISGKVIMVGKYMMTFPENILNEK